MQAHFHSKVFADCGNTSESDIKLYTTIEKHFSCSFSFLMTV